MSCGTGQILPGDQVTWTVADICGEALEKELRKFGGQSNRDVTARSTDLNRDII